MTPNSNLLTDTPVQISSGDQPSAVIARSWTGEAVPFGMDGEFQLRGGVALAPGRLPLDMDLDWAGSVLARVTEACFAQTIAGRPWFTMPAACLVGRAGIGRTLIARTIARRAGVPFATIDVAGWRGSAALRPGGRSHDVVYPSSIAMALAASKCANPVVLVTGVDDAEPPAVDIVMSMVDPSVNARWTDHSLGAVLDLSHVTWLVQSSRAVCISRKLLHLPHLAIELDNDTLELRLLTLLSEVFDDLEVDQRAIETEGSRLASELMPNAGEHAALLRRRAEQLVKVMRAGQQ